MEALELKLVIILTVKSHIHLGVLRKVNAKSGHNFGRFAECNMLQLREC